MIKQGFYYRIVDIKMIYPAYAEWFKMLNWKEAPSLWKQNQVPEITSKRSNIFKALRVAPYNVNELDHTLVLIKQVGKEGWYIIDKSGLEAIGPNKAFIATDQNQGDCSLVVAPNLRVAKILANYSDLRNDCAFTDMRVHLFIRPNSVSIDNYFYDAIGKEPIVTNMTPGVDLDWDLFASEQVEAGRLLKYQN